MIMRETIEEVELKEKPILRKETANNALKKRQEQKIWVEQGTYNGALNYHSFKRIESRVTRLRPQWDVLPSGVSLAKATCKLWLLWFSPCFLLRNKQSHRNISGASLSLSSPLPGLVVCSLQQPQNTQMPWDHMFSVQNYDSWIPFVVNEPAEWEKERRSRQEKHIFEAWVLRHSKTFTEIWFIVIASSKISAWAQQITRRKRWLPPVNLWGS